MAGLALHGITTAAPVVAATQQVLPLTPAQGPAGTAVTAGSKVDPGAASTCVVQLGNVPLADASCRWQDVGLVEASFAIPADAAPQSYEVTFHSAVPEPDSGRTLVGSATFTVLAVVPDVVGQTAEDARRRLAGAALAVGASTPDDAADDAVVERQDPLAGTEVPAKTPVDLVFAADTAPASPVPERVAVPQFVGLTMAEARTAARDVLKVVGPAGRRGPVTSQSVPAGTLVAPGTVIRVTTAAVDKPSTGPNQPEERPAATNLASEVATGLSIVGVLTLAAGLLASRSRRRSRRDQRVPPSVRVQVFPDPRGRCSVDVGAGVSRTLRVHIIDDQGQQTLEEVR